MTTNPWQFEAPWLQSTPGNPEAALGAAIWLWMHDFRHRSEALQDMEHRLLAPIEAGQYVIARQASTSMHPPQRPQALLLFARFDEKAESRYLADPSQKIAMRDWQSGSRLWLIDWTAPFGHTSSLREPVMALLAGCGARSICRSGRGTGSRVRLWQRPLDQSGSLPPGVKASQAKLSHETAAKRKEPAHL
ncbi:toxin-activating lysine-acyltransferase [Hydrogenophaga sp.]|uniref:toxin-activating lysine-acyltransferase n=1 Tax=Hydrogenophaga sp. TaxID=1904254 RepID=UPI003F7217F4